MTDPKVERNQAENYKFRKAVNGDIFVATTPALKTSDGDYVDIDVQNPLPTDGDSVYAKDLDLTNSSIGNFSGDIRTLFNDYNSNNIAASVGSGGANPKSFTVVLQRPVGNTTIGLASADSSISNVKITLKDLIGNTVKVIDNSADNTKRGVQVFQFEQKYFREVLVEFYTDDEVSISGMAILKSINVSIDAINGVVSEDNSSDTPLLANDFFLGEAIDTKNYGSIIVSVLSNVVSAVDGLQIEFAKTPTGTWYPTDNYTITSNEIDKLKTFGLQTVLRFMRVRYTNGTSDQTTFLLSTQLKPVYVRPTSHRVGDSISPEDDAELTKAVLSGQDEVTDIFENVKTFNGSLNVTDGLVHKQPIIKYFSRDIGGSTTPSVAINAGDVDVTFTSITDFAIGDFIDLHEGIVYEMSPLQIENIVGNVITFNRPIDNDYTTSANIDEIQTNMNVDGSTNSASFRITPPSGEIWQMTRIIINMTDDNTMDDTKFGSLTALSNGLLVRTIKSGIVRTPTIWQTNGDMANDMYDLTYPDKVPAGTYALRGRWTFTKMAVIIELDGSNGDYAEILVQDDLTGINTFSIKGSGRIFGG